MTKLLKSLRGKGITVLVAEHDRDVISIADEVIDVGPPAGRAGGEIMFQSSLEKLLSFGTFAGRAICQVDYSIDTGPDGGTPGGELVFCGTPKQMAETVETITARCLRKSL